MAVPILRKKAASEKAALHLELRLYPEPEFDDEENMVNPAHWRLIDHAVGEGSPVAWGPLHSFALMQRLFALAGIAASSLPPDVVESNLRSMGIVPQKEIRA